MNHTFSLEKKNDRYSLRIHCHNPPPNNDEWDTYVLNSDELQSLRDVLGVPEHTHTQLYMRINKLDKMNADLTRDIDRIERTLEGVVTHLRGI